MSNACGARSPDGSWRCSFLPPHGPRHSWDSVRPAVLLRDTPEDRERLIAALDHMTLTGQDDPFLELIWTNRSDEGDGGASSLALPQEVADAIIAALRVDGTSTRIESDSTRGER